MHTECSGPALLAAGLHRSEQSPTDGTSAAPTEAPSPRTPPAAASRLPDGPVPRHECLVHKPSTLKTALYIIGGATKPGGPALAHGRGPRLNVSTNTWSSKPTAIKLEEANQASS